MLGMWRRTGNRYQNYRTRCNPMLGFPTFESNEGPRKNQLTVLKEKCLLSDTELFIELAGKSSRSICSKPNRSFQDRPEQGSFTGPFDNSRIILLLLISPLPYHHRYTKNISKCLLLPPPQTQSRREQRQCHFWPTMTSITVAAMT